MSREPQRIFLERRSYRRRRLVDAGRLMPVFGLVLFFLPLLWAGNGSTSGGFVYLFIAWGLLIAIMAVLARSLSGAVSGDWRKDDHDTDGAP
ncbi:MAG: hypothetical protein AAGO57_01875 [Pseudomonadota bacterium]